MRSLRGMPAQVAGLALLKVLGAMLVLAGLGLLAVTENGLLNYRRAADRHGGEVLDVAGQGGPRAGLYGSMLRVAGPIQVVAPPRDDDFNQSVATPVMVRRVEMFQWREVRVGSSAHYELDWVDHPIDSSHFIHPAGHENPGHFPIQGRQFDAGEVHVDGFILSNKLLHAIPGDQRMTPDVHALPPNLAATFTQLGDYLVTSEHPDAPHIGDLRVSWDIVPLQTITVVGRLDGAKLVPALQADDQGYQVQVGDRPLVDVFPDLPIPPDGVMPKRIAAFVLTVLGMLSLFWTWRKRLSDLLLPVGAATSLFGAVAGAIWLAGRSSTAMHWLMLALAGMVLSAWPLWRHYRGGESGH